VGRHHCWSWFAFQSLVIQLLFAATQFILMLRVWVLYHRTRVTLGFLGLLWAWERLVMMGTALIISFNIEFGPQCVQGIDNVPHAPIIVIIVTAIVVQIVVWGMTWTKLYLGEIPRIPLTRRLSFDGTVVCASVVAFYASTVPYSFYSDSLTHNIYSIMITLFSVLGCRIIINLRTLPSREGSNQAERSSSDSDTWCLDTLEESTTDLEFPSPSNSFSMPSDKSVHESL